MCDWSVRRLILGDISSHLYHRWRADSPYRTVPECTRVCINQQRWVCILNVAQYHHIWHKSIALRTRDINKENISWRGRDPCETEPIVPRDHTWMRVSENQNFFKYTHSLFLCEYAQHDGNDRSRPKISFYFSFHGLFVYLSSSLCTVYAWILSGEKEHVMWMYGDDELHYKVHSERWTSFGAENSWVGKKATCNNETNVKWEKIWNVRRWCGYFPRL